MKPTNPPASRPPLFRWCDHTFATRAECERAIASTLARQLCDADAGSVDTGEEQPRSLEIRVHILSANGEREDEATGGPITPPERAPLCVVDLLGRALEYVESYQAPAECDAQEAARHSEDAQQLAHSIRNALHVATLAQGEELGGPAPDLAALFRTMPEPPDDMASLDGLTAYAEAVLEWRARQGFPSQYDGPVGPS